MKNIQLLYVTMCCACLGCASPRCSEKAQAVVEPDTSVARPITASHSSVTFEISCRKTQPRYVYYQRDWAESVKIERQSGDGWEKIVYSTPIYSEPCPHCVAILPSTPWPRIKPIDGLSLTWNGLIYETEHHAPKNCFCHYTTPAPPGKYRVLLTLYQSMICDNEGCPSNEQGEIEGVGKGEPLTVSAEFMLTDIDQTVNIAACP